jgi:hypothetical protein
MVKKTRINKEPTPKKEKKTPKRATSGDNISHRQNKK